MSPTDHWLLQRQEPARRGIDGGTIVETAHTLVHESGLNALSMRILASELGTSTSALYRHVPSKQWLLVAVADHVLGELTTDPAGHGGADARERLDRLSSAYRDVLVAHPHLHEVLTSNVVLTPNTVRIAATALRCLHDLGLEGDELVDAYNAWCGYVVGFTILETKPAEREPAVDLQIAMRTQLDAAFESNPILAELPEGSAANIYGLRWRQATLGGSEGSFDYGLKIVIEGLMDRARRGRTNA